MGDSPQHSSMLPLLIPIRDRLWTTKNCKGQWGSTLIEPTSLSRIVRFDTDQPEMIAQALKKKTSEIYCSLELSDCILKSLQRLKCFVQSGINIAQPLLLLLLGPSLHCCALPHCVFTVVFAVGSDRGCLCVTGDNPIVGFTLQPRCHHTSGVTPHSSSSSCFSFSWNLSTQIHPCILYAHLDLNLSVSL